MFAAMVWAMLPNALSKTLIDYETEIGTYWKHFVRIKSPGFYLHARKNASNTYFRSKHLSFAGPRHHIITIRSRPDGMPQDSSPHNDNLLQKPRAFQRECRIQVLL